MMGTNSLNVIMHDTVEEAPKYERPDYKGADLVEAHIIGKGTVEGNPTVDLIFVDGEGQQFKLAEKPIQHWVKLIEETNRLFTELEDLKMDPNTLNILLHDTIGSAPNYGLPEFKGVDLIEAHIVRGGTVGGNPTVDLVLTDAKGQKYVTMITGRILQSLSRIVTSVAEG